MSEVFIESCTVYQLAGFDRSVGEPSFEGVVPAPNAFFIDGNQGFVTYHLSIVFDGGEGSADEVLSFAGATFSPIEDDGGEGSAGEG